MAEVKVKDSPDDWQKKGTLGSGAFGRVTLWKHKVINFQLQNFHACETSPSHLGKTAQLSFNL